MLIVVMGVSGVGKSAVGKGLARALGVPFLEGDAFHPERNVEKMRAGIPLTDEDRAPWLQRMAEGLRAHAAGGAVLGCSALKRHYRDVLREGGQYQLVFLNGDRELIAGRMGKRRDHYMPASLLDSQIALLEPPAGDEKPLTVDVRPPTDEIVATVLERIEQEPKT